MEATEHINRLLGALGREAGVGLALEDGVCGIETASGGRLAVAAAADGDDVVWLYAPVAELGHSARSALLEKAMRLNFFGEGMGGAWLAMDDSGRSLLLCTSRPVLDLDETLFRNLLGNFAALAETIAAALTSGGNDLAAPSPVAQGLERQFLPAFGNFA